MNKNIERSKTRLKILITNDDGYYSDGLRALEKAISRFADTYVVVPDREQSASSHSLTLNRPLRVQKLDKHKYTTDGTPTDCVMLAIHLFFKKKKPDMIISGINHGGNMGDDVTYSGTIAAAIEGSILGVPSIAVSMANWRPNTNMTRAARFVSRLVKKYDQMELDPTTFLNVNFPADCGQAYSRCEFTKLGFRQYKDVVIHKTDPRGKPYYWIGGRPKWKSTGGTDFEAIQRGVVSITPLKLNFTDQTSLDRIAESGFRL
ncbi:MAG: 5'/3'-nucleotidase SurE [bacterium]|nr:5'/3'-nucleotidase SurE [bacterium]